VKKRIVYKKFNKLIKKIKTVNYSASALNLLVKHKIVICLLREYITKNEKQWLKNENYLFSEFLQRVRALKS